MKILNVVGARPNFMKVAPLNRALQQHPHVQSRIVHTGQHYDEKMSDIFFRQLELPQPDYYLGIGGGTHTQQTARIMLAFEELLGEYKPGLIVVVGDVNSTLAASLVAKKEGILLAHVEAGLRSGDRGMPEELNRILTDSISDYLFVSEMAGMINLSREGVAEQKMFFVGNVMIDSLIFFRQKASQLKLEDLVKQRISSGTAPSTPTPSFRGRDYALMTMHRPSNVDDEQGLNNILQIIRDTVQRLPLIFAIHPRTYKHFEKFGLLPTLEAIPGLVLLPPQGYLQFLKLMDNAALIITDSGGIQEETTYLQIPCLTLRQSTERPSTVELGTNFLMHTLDPDAVRQKVDDILDGRTKKGVIPPFWDGMAAERIAEILARG
ncbi:MAG: UDP-N-acetylglucosamine 2-epimerase (non-hydrolyzing) [Lewinellaceae bacterium]|nr:UDP-N-acetylglucosamine 2-epimerase (non-hydrolyzing) [Phaeodactylibacter sp.]MCB9350168.1 UDP-N-acetylglucosamine 2-epimerase (non-hydrolyzing) [Lewinellaceae bacterium]